MLLRKRTKANRRTMLDYGLELNHLLPFPGCIKNYVDLTEANILYSVYEGYIQKPQQLIIMILAFATIISIKYHTW